MAAAKILFSDDHVVAVDKPPRMLVVPAPGHSAPTLVDVVQQQLGTRLFAVHRLDRDTTGVLLLARTAAARAALEERFREHRIERVYLAVVSRVPSPTAGRIESNLRENARGVVQSVERGPGRRAVTEYETLRRLDRGALVECRPETGRRNQIRVHMADLGCPIVGDRKYGYRVRGGETASALMLHAWKLAMDHPFSGRRLELESPLPDGFPSI